MKKVLIAIVACLFVLGIATTANAAVITPGTATSVTGALPTNFGLGTHVITDFSTLVSYDSIALTITQNVWLNSTGYLFYYQITRTDSTGNALGRFTTTNFKGFMTDTDAYSPGELPHTVDRSLLGDSLGFAFQNGTSDPGLAPGVNSATMWIQTNAQYLSMGTGNFINGGVFTTPLYCPGVPEPGTVMMLGMGLVGLMGSVIRRKFMA